MQRLSRVTFLRYGGRPVFVDVTVLERTIRVPPLPKKDKFREVKRGNLIVDYSPGEAQEVRSALAKLH